LAKKSGVSEAEVARRAVQLAKQPQRGNNVRANERRAHVGFYLCAEGRQELELALESRFLAGEIREAPETVAGRFVRDWHRIADGGAADSRGVGAEVSVPIFLVIALFLLPAAESAVAIANQLAVMFVSRARCPKWIIPREFRSRAKRWWLFPTLLTSREQMERAVRDLEIRFLVIAITTFILRCSPIHPTRRPSLITR